MTADPRGELISGQVLSNRIGGYEYGYDNSKLSWKSRSGEFSGVRISQHGDFAAHSDLRRVTAQAVVTMQNQKRSSESLI